MRLSEKSKIVLPLLLIAFFVFSTFGLIYRFQNHQLGRIIEAERLLDQISEAMFEINRTSQSGILTLDERYDVQSARYSLIVFEKLAELNNLQPADAAKIRRMYLAYYVKIVSINSLFLEKRLDEGRTRLAEIDSGFSEMSAELEKQIDFQIAQYRKAVRNINVFMAVTSAVFTAMLALIVRIFMSYSRKRKEAEKALIESEKMASLGLLSAGVAHEIRNPLTIILHGAELLEAPSASAADRHDITIAIRQAVVRAEGIIKGLLSFSQGPQGPGSGRETLDIPGLLDEALLVLGQQRELRNIRIVKEFSPGTPEARGDRGQLRQAFLNILINAAEAVPGGGILSVLCGKTNAHSLLVTFIDTGEGIPEAELGKVYDPFFSTKQKAGNIGLGLSIARGIIEGQGGTLRIESAQGQGTRVTITLPAAEGIAEPASA